MKSISYDVPTWLDKFANYSTAKCAVVLWFSI